MFQSPGPANENFTKVKKDMSQVKIVPHLNLYIEDDLECCLILFHKNPLYLLSTSV